MAEKLIFTVLTEHDSMNAGRYLRTVCRLSARTLAVLKRTENGITANGKLLRTIDTVYAGDIIEMNLPAENSDTVIPVDGDLDILYEDDYILIVNKPPFAPVHPVKDHQADTLANLVAHRYKEFGENFVFRAVNRLDRNTSGIVVIARDRHTASLLHSADLNKHYTAVCHGNIHEKGTIDAPIALCGSSKIVRCVDPDGQHAVTHYKAEEQLKGATILDVVIETGRTHQIRCHMSHIGHPLFGDDLYGGKLEHINRQALHCRTVSFIHPFTSEQLCFTAPISEDIKSLIKHLQ